MATLHRVAGAAPPGRVRPLLVQLPPDLRYEHVQLYLRCLPPGGKPTPAATG